MKYLLPRVECIVLGSIGFDLRLDIPHKYVQLCCREAFGNGHMVPAICRNEDEGCRQDHQQHSRLVLLHSLLSGHLVVVSPSSHVQTQLFAERVVQPQSPGSRSRAICHQEVPL